MHDNGELGMVELVATDGESAGHRDAAQESERVATTRIRQHRLPLRDTYIDGDAGILRYRGYPIEQLAG